MKQPKIIQIVPADPHWWVQAESKKAASVVFEYRVVAFGLTADGTIVPIAGGEQGVEVMTEDKDHFVRMAFKSDPKPRPESRPFNS